MPKKKPTVSFALRSRSSSTTLFRWLYDDVARGTVVAAFDQLATEGYVESGVGNGTFVRWMLTEPGVEAKSAWSRSRGKLSHLSLSAGTQLE
jgi:DNA-binding transcriptional MocR family regulator